MAAIFTPGLKVTERTVVQKDRRLPLEGEVLVKTGDLVKADTIVARTELPGKVYPVNVANQLGVDPGRLGEFMKFKSGDTVTEGQLIAETPGFMGFFKGCPPRSPPRRARSTVRSPAAARARRRSRAASRRCAGSGIR